MKKFLLLFAALFALCISAHAADGDTFTVDNLKYTVTSESDHEVSLTGCVYGNNPTGDLEIPSFVTNGFEQYSVTSIGDLAFWFCSSLTSVIIPNSVTSIGSRAFSLCTSLTSVKIPNSVNIIGYGPFSDCPNLECIEVEDGNAYYCSLDGILYNFSKTELIQAPGAISTVDIPDSVTSIGDYAFNYCPSLTSVIIPNSVTSIGSDAFFFCYSLTSVIIPNSVISIGEHAFDGCNDLYSVTLPDSITSIENGTFSYCFALTSMTIPNSVKNIEPYAFAECESLESIVISSSVQTIGNYAFSGCSSLHLIYTFAQTPPDCSDGGNQTFSGCPTDAVIYVPKGTCQEYAAAEGWSYFNDFREMGTLTIQLNETALDLEEGASATLDVTVVKDDDVVIESETWTSSNPNVATVENGVVTAVNEGTATITLTIIDGYGCTYTEYCNVTVTFDYSGIDIIAPDSNDAPIEYYDLNGKRVSGDYLAPGFYIKRQGSKSTKVLIK